MKARPKIFVVANTAWYLANFRSSLIRTLIAKGFEVVAVAPQDDYVEYITQIGCRFVPMKMDNQGTNPIKDSWLFVKLLWLFINERPLIFLGYTVKVNVYGGLAALLLAIPAVNNIAGLGTVFVQESWVTRIVESLYRVGLEKASKVFFQNNEDLALFIERKLVKSESAERIPGSGVDTQHFAPNRIATPPRKLPAAGDKKLVFLLSARLLWDKGVGEFIEAARLLQAEGVAAEFQLLGFLDVDNPRAIRQSDVSAWESEGVAHYMGTVHDVRPVIAQADCVVLPSYYREGVPRSLLEAASMAKVIVTADSVGCRDAVDDGVTGFLCQPKNSVDLAEKMQKIIGLTPEERHEMGLLGREKIIREFDEHVVIDRYLDVIQQIIINQSSDKKADSISL